MAFDSCVQLRISRSRKPTIIRARLLFSSLHRHEAHSRPAHRLAKRLGVGGIVLAALHVWLDQLRRDQLHLMAERPQQPRPIVRRAASLNCNYCWRKILEESHHVLAPQLLAQNRLIGGVYPVKLEKVLRRIHTNSANLFHGWSPSSEICN